ncbi:NAD(P)-dependent oxidoreductase [Agromyces laixinhei]|uniref:NAD(P)-dependent oxidoreductase n=1 Tax=Agromyces laixinhei TaxID=2585717 RepID=UPI0011172651|nr:NAD(P)-binding oxidoreductase [Agromyces laixinhei]
MEDTSTHIVVVGASGRTGRLVVEQALHQGHRVTAIVRNLGSSRFPPSVATVVADVVQSEEIALPDDTDVVISALGKKSNKERTPVCTAGTKHVLAAMQRAGVRRLVVTSASPVLQRRTGEPAWFRWTIRPLVRWFGRHIYTDLEEMETLVRHADDVEWSIVRPGYLVDRPAGPFELVQEANAMGVVHRADVATALLSIASRPETQRVAFGIASRPESVDDA